MAFILLHIVAPMQSWGSRSRFEYRDTEREPTFSGIVGLIAASMGLDRSEDISHLEAMDMTIRVDKEGILQQEFQTAQGVLTASGAKKDQIIRRDYLSDAEFHVALEAEQTLLKNIYAALCSPVFPVFFGRKSYVPACPIVYPNDQSLFLTSESPLDVLSEKIPITLNSRLVPTLVCDSPGTNEKTQSIRFVVSDTNKTGEMRLDIPTTFDMYKRSYHARYIKSIYREVRVYDEH
jgi:CRISPR system Cascade subunit CasD